jgi:hypothetical protein
VYFGQRAVVQHFFVLTLGSRDEYERPRDEQDAVPLDDPLSF